jgi:hypothetical protein
VEQPSAWEMSLYPKVYNLPKPTSITAVYKGKFALLVFIAQLFISSNVFSVLSILSHGFQYLIWIERVAQTIANIVDRDDADEDHKAWEDSQPGIFDEVILRSGE